MNDCAVIWDLDGTLIDSHDAHYRAWQDVAQEYDIPFDDAMFQAAFGLTNHLILSRWLGARWTKALEREIAARKEAHYRAIIRDDIRLLPGALDCLRRLRQSGWKQALGSSAPWENINAVLDALDIRSYLDAVCSAQDMPSKPDPAVFLAAARALRVAPARCIVVEDAPAGVEAARRAGMRCLAVTTSHAPAALDTADLIVPGLDALSPAVFVRLVMPVDARSSR